MAYEDAWQAALADWRGVLGDRHVHTDAVTLAAYTANVSGLRRDVPVVLCPASTAEVQRVVHIANTHRTPLYPISRGKNWGMGSRLPVRDGAAIVDLSRMNRIREISAAHAYAVVEPGVTQGSLHAHLEAEGLPFFFNVTGSGLETSVIGNALERGVGYFASRADALSGLEVVMGNGEILRTGNGHFANSLTTHLYRYGLGPSLDGLFAQSNFGIVTAAGMELMPRREAQMAILAKLTDPARLEAFVQALADLRKREIVRSAIHIANRARTVSVLGPLVQEQLMHAGSDPDQARAAAERMIAAEGFGPWSAVGGVQGSPAELRETVRQARGALAGIARVTVLTDGRLARATAVAECLSGVAFFRRKLMLLRAVAPLYGLAKGVPTDEPMKSAYWCVNAPVPSAGELDPDQGPCGLLFSLPMIPLSGTDAVRAVAAVETIFGRERFEAYITLNTVNTRVLEGVINLVFDRRDAARVAAAQRCIEELDRYFLDIGYTPYRLGIQSMGGLIHDGDSFWRTVRELKQVFDPNHILAPGRYNLV